MTRAYIDPTRDSFDVFKTLDRETPIEMLNLVQFREVARYPESHPLARAGSSGADAYARYGSGSAPILARQGGEIVWRGHFDAMLIGPPEERWDACFIVRYPSAHAFLGMIKDPAYAEAVVHRTAGVATSRLIRTSPAAAGEGFG